MPVALLGLDVRAVDDAVEGALGASCEVLLHSDDDIV